MKYTDDEKVISILEYCVALHANVNLTLENVKALLDLINRQKAEIERLRKLGAAATGRLVEVKAEANKELERMKEEANKYPCRVRMNDNSIVRSKSLEDYDRLIGDISAEAIKEFAERLILVEETTAINCATNEKVVRVADIDTLVKEKTEAKK